MFYPITRSVQPLLSAKNPERVRAKRLFTFRCGTRSINHGVSPWFLVFEFVAAVV